MAGSSSHRRDRPPSLLLVFLLAAAASVSLADINADYKECQTQLVQLQPCLPYVSKQGVKPTPECCESLTQVLSNSMRCLCILIKDRNDPSVKKFNIDLDRAVSMPGACGVKASTSECPNLLKLAPGSPDAQIFKDVDGRLSGSNSTGGAGMGAARLGWLGVSIWVYSSIAALLLVVVPNVHGA